VADNISQIDPLIQAALLLSKLQLQLEQAGYTRRLVKAAIDRARGSAQYKVRAIRPSIQSEAFYDVLLGEVQNLETWIGQERGDAKEVNR
jgi:hypothetical protein